VAAVNVAARASSELPSNKSGFPAPRPTLCRGPFSQLASSSAFDVAQLYAELRPDCSCLTLPEEGRRQGLLFLTPLVVDGVRNDCRAELLFHVCDPLLLAADSCQCFSTVPLTGFYFQKRATGNSSATGVCLRATSTPLVGAGTCSIIIIAAHHCGSEPSVLHFNLTSSTPRFRRALPTVQAVFPVGFCQGGRQASFSWRLLWCPPSFRL